MKKYWIIKENGEALFELPYPEDFIYHCLFKLIDVTDEKFKLLPFPCLPVTELNPISILYLGATGHPKAHT